jgi:coproporphyrinogen III oxidase
MTFADKVSDKFKEIQDSICAALEKADGKSKFQEDAWTREGGGGGRTRVLQHGDVIEKGGVNFSAVHGTLPNKISTALGLNSSEFFATGVSIVMHPNHPHIPIIHMNIRYFETKDDNGNSKYWFGGGIDLTPHYIQPEQASWFHQQLKSVCDQFDAAYYPKFKKWADDYFFIEHRDETRGVGGIFFDRLSDGENRSMEELFDYVVAVGMSFAPIYTHLIEINRDKEYTAEEKDWQIVRRGRYVEFNLVYDKGTKFGLDTKGRIESILMSLPLQAGWPYDLKVKKNSPEEQTLSKLKKGIDWVSMK